LTHRIEHTEWTQKLPQGVQLAYDGLRLQI
jgi:hypothetical protein